jgi:hypothetical protein
MLNKYRIYIEISAWASLFTIGWRNTDIMVMDPMDPYQSDGVVDFNKGGLFVVRPMVKNPFPAIKYIRFNWQQLRQNRDAHA